MPEIISTDQVNPLVENSLTKEKIQRANDNKVFNDLSVVASILSSQHSNISSTLESINPTSKIAYDSTIGKIHGATALDWRRVAAEVGMTYAGNNQRFTGQTEGVYALAVSNTATTYIRQEAPTQIFKSKDTTQIADNTLHRLANLAFDQLTTQVTQVNQMQVNTVGTEQFNLVGTNKREVVNKDRVSYVLGKDNLQVDGKAQQDYKQGIDTIVTGLEQRLNIGSQTLWTSGDLNKIVLGLLNQIVNGPASYIFRDGVAVSIGGAGNCLIEGYINMFVQAGFAISSPSMSIGGAGGLVFLGMGAQPDAVIPTEAAVPKTTNLNLTTYDPASLVVTPEDSAVEGTAANAVGPFNPMPVRLDGTDIFTADSLETTGLQKSAREASYTATEVGYLTDQTG
jgi:hypothetical protein